MKIKKKYFKTREKMLLYKNKLRKNNYKIGREYQERQGRWYSRELAILYIRDEEGTRSDREIARELKRSVQAIQVRRCLLGELPPSPVVQQIINDFKINGIPDGRMDL